MALADFLKELDDLSASATEAFRTVTADALEAVRIEFLGAKSGKLKMVQKQMGAVGKDDKPAAGKRLNVRTFFRVTSVLLILFAAGLVAHGVHELQEAGVLPIIIEHVWDINYILDEKSTLGSILKALFGYNGNPSLLETVSYAAYYLKVGTAIGLEQRTIKSAPEFY